MSDGAAALLLMKRKQAKELGLGVMGKLVGFATAGVDPRVMGIGPAVAIPKVLEQVRGRGRKGKLEIHLWVCACGVDMHYLTSFFPPFFSRLVCPFLILICGKSMKLLLLNLLILSRA